MAAPEPHGPPLPDFAQNDQEAQARYDTYRQLDPFPAIPPALLNSADLLDYIAAAGILSPYAVTEETRDLWLKPASCAVPCSGVSLRYEFDKRRGKVRSKPIREELQPTGRLWLPPNSIVFLQLGTVFRIPEYIAARFNLAIREIHRGMLVGTGPLVDPGFVGQLLIPLHNLTSNDYSVKVGEPLVWVEFTKLSPNERWANDDPAPRQAGFSEFPERKLERRTPEHYLDHAHQGRPIASSIPKEVGTAQRIAESARRRVNIIQAVGAVGIVIAAFTAVLPMINLVSDTNDRLDAAARETERQRAVNRRMSRELRNQRVELRRLRTEAAEIRRRSVARARSGR